jgi:penicillin-binding protein 1A
VLDPDVKRALWKSAWVVLAAVFAGAFAGFAAVILTDLPEVAELDRYKPKGVTLLKDIHGETIHEFFVEKRIPVTLDAIPDRVQRAFLAAEDWRFHDHFGIDLRGLLRAFVRNVVERRYAEGASTITQQLSKLLFLTSEKTLARKLKEALLAIQIERRYSKKEILALYLNQIYLGSGCYGVEAAARTYFGKGIGELDVAETALLAGLPKAPSRFSPFVDPEAAHTRRDVVLQSMFENGVLTKEEWRAAKEVPLPSEPAAEDRVQSYFAAHVLGLLLAEVGEEQVFRGRVTVETTLDLGLQRTAEAAVQRGIEAYAARHRIKVNETAKLPQAALLAVDVRTGEIRAMAGGRDFKESQFNRSVQAVRQPGSSMKPVLYAAALERGYTQSTLVDDSPISFFVRGVGKWEPKNYDKKYSGWIPLRVAVEKSKNVVAVRTLQAIGVKPFSRMAERLGITTPVAPNLSSALGSSSVKLSDLVRAYATLAAGGLRPNLRAIRSVKADLGEVWPPPPPSQPVLDPRVAYVMTDLLTGVVQAGTGTFARDLPCAVAGKTGTTDDNVDSLFVGFSTSLAVVAWMGFDDRKSLGDNETGAVAAGPIWREFMETACDAGEETFHPPPGVLLVDVDHSSGKLPGRYCTDIVTEAFIEGTQPRDVCDEENIPEM